jgi:enoyl-CoA hydratase/carnithine racemase
VIAAVNGACAGVGLALACCADIRVASSDAFFLAPFARLGLTAELGLGWLLPRLVGTGGAMHILMAAERISAREAAEMGLVNAVVKPENFLAEAQAYATRIAKGSAPGALATIKRQVYGALSQDFAAAEDEAFRLTFESLEGGDFKEAVTAMKERRDPDFPPVAQPFLTHR